MSLDRMNCLLLALCAGLLVAGCVPITPIPPASADSATPAAQSAAAAYCAESGGVVETRYPFFGTGGAAPLQLAGSLDVCVFTSAQDGTRILVAADTLYAEQPTLAALAYLNPPPMQGGGQPSANPSSLYCSQLGGTDLFGGVNAAGGGWGKEGGADSVALCIFPDLSSIDSWGLTYHSDGVIRGADLSDLLRYQPE
jgi:putative hemolysin